MRYILSMLILLTSLSFFTIACGGDTTSSSDVCSATNTSGTCPTDKHCDNGVCVTDNANTCSATNVNGTCSAGKHCDNGTCVNDTCTPQCAGKTCGADGCGGTCGSCNANETCNAAGTCETGTCTAKTCADLSRTCGSVDDGCGTQLDCGTCGTGEYCDATGTCKTGTCTADCAGKTCGDDGCGGSCGSCNANETCNAAGTCVAGCTADCAGKTCGDDGCGGSCGSCNMGETCNAAGTCDAGCTANCAGKTCGDDGCGGSCGSCNANETCDANGACQTNSANGELGGNCDQQNPCADNTNLCLGPQDGQAICYQACNGTSDTSCTQTNYTCQDVPNVGFVCLPNPNGNTAIGGDCSTEACVEAAICLNPDAPTCYEKCTAATDTCATSGYTCQDTGNTDIGWVCAPHSEPGNAQPGESCSAENNCVDTAMCLSTDGGTTNTCYEKCTAATDTCSQTNYTCQDTGVAGIDWICMTNPVGNSQPGDDCSTEACVDTAMCLNTGAGTPQICYEKCTAATDTCSQTNYTCQDTGVAGIDWICMTNPVGDTPIGGDCSNAACVAEASCLSDGTNSLCYEKCDPNAGGTCSQANYTCAAVAGANFCMPPQ